MGIIDNLRARLASAMENRKAEREAMERMQREMKMQEQIMFEQEYKKKALEVAKARAIADAERLSGYAKIKALNRATNLQNINPNNSFSRLAEYTQRNLARTQERLQKTKIMRQAIMQEKQREAQLRAIKKPFYRNGII